VVRLTLPDSDRRVKMRIPIVLWVELAWRDGDISAFSVDLAESGMFVKTDLALPQDTEVRLRFNLPGRSGLSSLVMADGKVSRVIREGGLAGIAVRFERFVEGREALQEWFQDQVGPSALPAPGGEERRRHPRMQVGLPVVWGTASPPEIEGFLADLSESGAFVLQAEELAGVGERVFVEFDIPWRDGLRRVKIIAVVVRRVTDAELGPGKGIEFEYSSVESKMIRRFIAEQRELEALRKQS